MQNMYKLHKTSKSSLTLSEVGGFGFPECANILPNGHTIIFFAYFMYQKQVLMTYVHCRVH